MMLYFVFHMDVSQLANLRELLTMQWTGVMLALKKGNMKSSIVKLCINFHILGWHEDINKVQHSVVVNFVSHSTYIDEVSWSSQPEICFAWPRNS